MEKINFVEIEILKIVPRETLGNYILQRGQYLRQLAMQVIAGTIGVDTAQRLFLNN